MQSNIKLKVSITQNTLYFSKIQSLCGDCYIYTFTSNLLIKPLMASEWLYVTILKPNIGVFEY